MRILANRTALPTGASPVVAAWVILVLTVASRIAVADMPDTSDALREQRHAELLGQMRSLAQATKVSYPKGSRQPMLVSSPVFRYDDQPRRFLDATLWVWTDADRPVAFEKIEAMAQDRPQWGYCFTSVAAELLAVKWGDGREFRATAPGVDFQPLANAPSVPSRDTARKFEARKLVRDFSARILTDDRANTSESMRLLPKPIFEYSDLETKSFQGAVFGLTTGGTNPDLLILLEPREADGQLAWHYAIGRMTIGGVTLKYRDTTVWKVDYIPPRPTDFPTWTFFQTSREARNEDRAR
jgi:hypothetical protein